jgi:hypothetical protein
MAREVYENRWLRPIFRLMKAIPVARGFFEAVDISKYVKDLREVYDPQTKSLRVSIELQPLNGSSRPRDDDAFIVAVWSPNPKKEYPIGEWEYEYRRIFFCFGVWQVETLSKAPEWSIKRDELLAVPAPAAIGLGMLGLGLVGWYMRRFA